MAWLASKLGSMFPSSCFCSHPQILTRSYGNQSVPLEKRVRDFLATRVFRGRPCRRLSQPQEG